MKTHSFIHGRRLAVVSVILLLAVSVLAGTVYAVTLDGTVFSALGAKAGDAVSAAPDNAINVYTQINNVETNRQQRIALTCPGADSACIYTKADANPVISQTIYENANPLTNTNTGLRLLVANAGRLRYALTDTEAQKDSVSISNVHIYRLDVDSKTATEEITDSVFDGKITVGGAHDTWQGDQYLDIDLSKNAGDLLVSFDAQYYNSPIRVKTSGAHTDSITVSVQDQKGRIGTYTNSTRADDSVMTDSFTLTASERYADKWLYSDASYVIESSGDQKLSQASLYYHDKSQNKWVTSTFSSADNGKTIEVFVPKELDYKDSSSKNSLTVAFESGTISTKKAQVYIAQNGSGASYPSRFVTVTTLDASDQPTQAMFQNNGNGIQAYSSVDFKSSSDAVSNKTAYQIAAGAKVRVDFTFDPAESDPSYYNGHPDYIKAIIQKRIEFKGFRIRRMSGSTEGTVIQETSDGVRTLTFTMPSDSDIRIEPLYHDHFHGVNIIANDKNSSNQNYRIDNSTRGTATLTAKSEAGMFSGYGWSGHGSTNNTDYFSTTWSYTRSHTVDGTSYTLTVTPKSENGVQRYTVKSVTAYQYNYSSTASRNYAYNGNMPNPCTWLQFDSSGNVTNTPVSDVVGALSEPDENGVVTCDVTLPYDMDKNGSIGNIILYVEFEEIESASIYSQFKYEVNQPDGASSFNPRTVIQYENSNIEGISADYDISGGADCKVVYYDTDAAEADRRTVNIALGGTNAQSAFYYTNLVYTLTSYDGTESYGSFRYFKDAVTVLNDAGGKLSDIISIAEPSAFSPADTRRACSTTVFTLKVPKNGGLKITCAPQETYVPVSVSQYVVDSEGNVVAADNSFSATVTKYKANNSTDDYVCAKYFTQSFSDDYYSMLTSNEGFADSFTVTGDTEEIHNMALDSKETGYYINPVTVPDGYEITAIDCAAYDRAGNRLSNISSYDSNDSYFSYGNRPTAIAKDSNGFKIRVNAYSQGYSRSWRQKVKVYYTKVTKLTVHQYLNEALANNNNISTVALANNSGTLPETAFTPYIDTTFKDSISFYISKNTRTSVTDTEYYWEQAYKVNQGTVPSVKITPTSTRGISEVKAYRLVDGEKQEIALTYNSSTGYYTFDSAAAAGEDLHIEITYAVQTTLRVKVRMLSDNNTDVDNNVSLTKATVNVTGHTVNADSTVDDVPFRRSGETEPFGTYTVETKEDVLVYGSSGTHLTIQTNFDGASNYVVANVKMSTSDGLADSTGWSDVTGITPASREIDGETAYNYNTCTVSGLTAGKNTQITVYLLRTAPMTVSVYTYDTSGVAHEGVPNRQSGTGEDTGSYVNVKANSSINSKAVITKIDEGNYNTGEFRLTYGQNYNRQVNVIQGATLEVFSMLPDSGDYVVKKIEGSGFTTGVGKVEYSNETIQDTTVRFLKTTIKTDGTIYPNHPGGYDVKIYIAPAKSIVTRARTVNGENYTKPNGTVTVYADNVESGVIPFTQVYPSASKFDTSYYTASTDYANAEPSYTTKTKTQAGTNLHFTVKPNTNYMIQSVDVRQGSLSGTSVKLRHSAPAADGTVTYTLLSGNGLYEMPALEDVYIDVLFAPRDTGKVTLDYQYTDDYVNWKPFFDDKGVGTIKATNSSNAFKDVLKLTNSSGEAADSFNISDNGSNTYTVVTGSTVTVSTSNLNNGWYIPVEAYITDKNGATVSSSNSYTYTSSSLSKVVNTGDELTFHVKFVPVANYYFKTIGNNVYNNSPDGVPTTDKTSRKAVTIAATNSGSGMSNPIRSSTKWVSSSDYMGQIAKGSTVTDIALNYRNLVYPGNIKSVSVYKFDKNADHNDLNRGVLIAELKDQNTYPNYDNGSVIYSSSVSENVKNVYNYNPDLTIEDQKVYVFYVEYDAINVYTTLSNAEGRVRPYLVYADNKNDFNISYSSGMNLDKAIPLTYSFDASYDCQFSMPIKNKRGPAYFVLESSIPREDLALTGATFKDYKDGVRKNILSELKADENYRTVVNQNGAKRYYYIYQIQNTDNPDCPVDNSMEFKITFRRVSDPGSSTTPQGEDKTAYVTVTQYDRVSYTDYNVSGEDTAVISHTDGTTMKIVGDGDNAYPQVKVPNGGLSAVQIISEKGKTLKLDLTPREGYNVEKIVINDGSKTTLYPKNADPAGSDTYYHKINSASATIDIYYAQPTLRVTATNKAEKPNAAVDVIDGSTTTRILKDTDYTNDMLVTKGDNKVIRILPVTYTTEEGGVQVEKKYTVDYIAIGDSYDNVLPIYDEYQNDPNLSEDYLVEKDEEGNYTLTLNSIDSDTYVFIQLMGETRILTSALEVRHHIYDVNLQDYVDCGEDNIGGTVTTYGVLSGTDNPLTNGSGEECSSFVLNSDVYSVTGGALAGTTLSFGITDIPDNFKVDKVEGKYGTGNTVYTASLSGKNRYQFGFNAPNSGVLYVDVYYGVNLTDYTLNYVYQGRSGGNNGNAFIGEDTATYDNKTYSVKVRLTDTYIKDGKPLASVLVENAPAVEDLYKSCVWTFDNNHVTYDTENNIVTITAVQNPKKCTVKFYYGEHSVEPETIDRVPINSLVQTDGGFITAPEKDSSGDFAYWKVEVDGKETAKCYDREFNLRVTGDSKITACYGANAKAITISEAKYSREQTTNENGNYSDILYADFILAYMENNGKLLNPKYDNHTTDDIKTGVIVEYDMGIQLQKEDEPGAILNDNEKVVFDAGDVLSNSDAQKLANGETLSGTDHKYFNFAVTNDKYNNHNRVDKVLSFVNSEATRHMVLRAYYYVWNQTTQTFEMTKPVYFYLYDIGNSVSQSQ